MENRKKVLVLTEMEFKGSGYFYLMSPILEEMSKTYDVRVVGLSYTGAEHHFGFSIVGAETIQDSIAIAQNIIKMWKPDIFICGLDIPLQMSIFDALKPLGVKYIAVTPLENPPLTQSWAVSLMGMNYVFFISELGKQTALKAGLTNVDHLIVGADTITFSPPEKEEKIKIREDLGLTDEFVILTVADNQERKNIWAEFEIISRLKKDGIKVKFILVTRENSQVGHKLRDLAVNYDLNRELIIIERGIDRENQLRNLYRAADIYLCASKAEGLGLPVLDAMASGLPVVACGTGALTELLEGGRGFLIPSEYEFIDVWGNSLRKMIDIEHAYKTLRYISQGAISSPAQDALDYIRTRTFDIPTAQMIKKVEELTNG